MEPKFHERVLTPNGPGLVQCQVIKSDGKILVQVSHKPDDYTGTDIDRTQPRMWVLREYRQEELREPEKKKV